jgi:hypothetical protein
MRRRPARRSRPRPTRPETASRRSSGSPRGDLHRQARRDRMECERASHQPHGSTADRGRSGARVVAGAAVCGDVFRTRAVQPLAACPRDLRAGWARCRRRRVRRPARVGLRRLRRPDHAADSRARPAVEPVAGRLSGMRSRSRMGTSCAWWGLAGFRPTRRPGDGWRCRPAQSTCWATSTTTRCSSTGIRDGCHSRFRPRATYAWQAAILGCNA